MNPFSPTFGVSPRIVVGRSQIIDRVVLGLANPYAPERKTLLLAPRGCGKTVILNEVQYAARNQGWHVIQDDGRPGMLDRVAAHATDLLQQHTPPPRRRLTGIHTSAASATWDNTPTPPPTLRNRLTQLATTSDGGLLLSIDEIHGADRAELVELANLIQHLDRELVPIAVVFAGLPGAERDSDPRSITFLSRCWRPAIETITDDEVATGFTRTAQLEHRSFTRDALKLCVQLTDGYPYLLQLAGWHAWEQTTATAITVADVIAARPAITNQLRDSVLSPLNRQLSREDRRFLAAMAHDNEPSNVGVLAARLARSPAQINNYRNRLLDAGAIRQTRRGHLEFAIPGLRALTRHTNEHPQPAPAHTAIAPENPHGPDTQHRR